MLSGKKMNNTGIEKKNPHQKLTGEGLCHSMTDERTTMTDDNFTTLADQYIQVCNNLNDEYHSLIDLVREKLGDKASILVYVSSIQALKEQLRNLGVIQ
jgi:hypothetical protein